MTKENFDYADVNLIPNKGIVNSRSECNTSVQLGKHTFKIPAYPANMESVINFDLCGEMAAAGYFYTMHRFITNGEQLTFIKIMNSMGLMTSISIGVTGEYYKLIDQIVEQNLDVDFITVDIAHGHSVMMQNMLRYLRMKDIKSFIIAGNVSTSQGANDLAGWGANAVKCGIAPGAACLTAMATRFGSRGMQASVIKEITDNLHFNIKVIADGGIKEHGDIAVALVMGADMVMVGSMFAGFKESTGEIVSDENGDLYKQYWGSASSGTSGKTNRIEGKKMLVPYKDCSIFDELKSIEESLQSAISYAGGRYLEDLFINTKFKVR